MLTAPLEPYDPSRPAPPWVRPLAGPIDGAHEVRVSVLSGYGLNCEQETAAGFTAFGARVDVRHVADALAGGGLGGVHIVVFVGGFSFGDHVASGRVFANRMRGRWGERLARFVDDGGLVLGICNGFQTIAKLGLVPGLDRAPGHLAPQQATLLPNARAGYYDGWVKLRIDPQSPCVFTRGSSGAILEVPARHAEGKLLLDPSVQDAVERRHCVPLRYVDAEGRPTEAWPDNPNGSPGGAAGLCDPTGRIFGLMPHPEAYLYPENHPDWIAQRDAGRLPAMGWGAGILANGILAALGA